MPPRPIHAAHQLVDMSISAHVYHLLLMAAFPGIGSQQRVIGQWRARCFCQVGMAPQSGHTRAQLVNMPVSPTVDQLLRSGILPFISNQSEPIGGSSVDGLQHGILQAPGMVLVHYQFINVTIVIHSAGIGDLLCVSILPASTCQDGILQLGRACHARDVIIAPCPFPSKGHLMNVFVTSLVCNMDCATQRPLVSCYVAGHRDTLALLPSLLSQTFFL